MKILIVNHSDIQGGAARAAYRLHRGLLDEGIDSKMLVQEKSSDDYTVLGPRTQKQKLVAFLRRKAEKLPLSKYKNRTATPFSPAWVPLSNMAKRINELSPDVVHLHWLLKGMLRVKELSLIQAPIVWSFHDTWAFTGGCHYMWDCDKYKTQCGACPCLRSGRFNDLSHKVWQQKMRVYKKLENVTLVGLSNWISGCVKSSSLLKDRQTITIPNLINTTVFHPIDKRIAREVLGLNNNRKYILFGALRATSDLRKGYKELSGALSISKHKDAELLIFGSTKPQQPQAFKQKAHYLGQLHDDVSLALLYSAADVTVVPSLQENLSNVIMESMACGTPVVGFNIGGNSDMIDHLQNGYLAKPLDHHDLANGIDWVLDRLKPHLLNKNAREKVMVNFDSKIVIKHYISLYENIIAK